MKKPVTIKALSNNTQSIFCLDKQAFLGRRATISLKVTASEAMNGFCVIKTIVYIMYVVTGQIQLVP